MGPTCGVFLDHAEELIHDHGHRAHTTKPAKAKPICMAEPAEISK
jgi:hypothetical protein